MAKMNRQGLVFFHFILLIFGLIIFIILKNFNFDDYRDSVPLTDLQIRLIYILFVGGIALLIGSLMFGYFNKKPEWATRGAIALIFIVLGVAIVGGALLHDQLLNQDEELGGLESLLMCLGSIIVIAGSFTYNSIKFVDDKQERMFIRAVREEIERVRAIPPRRQRRARASKRVAVASYPEPEEDQWVMAEAVPPTASTSQPATHVKCVRCKRMLKLTSDKRPITIKCPYCEAIGVIKD
jgi:hypothetical protein